MQVSLNDSVIARLEPVDLNFKRGPAQPGYQIGYNITVVSCILYIVPRSGVIEIKSTL